jgi:uncharacterized Fe-S cluster protein YjdI
MKPINVYKNREISVSFDAKKCINSQLCAKGLSSVVRNSLLPWNDVDSLESKRILNQIRKCPSGALKAERIKQELAKAI